MHEIKSLYIGVQCSAEYIGSMRWHGLLKALSEITLHRESHIKSSWWIMGGAVPAFCHVKRA